MVDHGEASRAQFRAYAGNGTTIIDRQQSLPPLEVGSWLSDPAGYVADAGLRDTVNVALTLGQPLLVTGEPGTGKTDLARSIAHELALPAPLVFNTKSTSAARDLFYRYDSLRHFHDAQFQESSTTTESYITYEALGLAILSAMPATAADPYLPSSLRGRGPVRSVVLIDEVDKAPRDLPNDVLNEIEQMSFSVAETRNSFAADPAFKPVVIFTSNSEKSLPDAFLRRCVFYHIPFPDRSRLREIVARRLPPEARFSPALIDHAITHFERIRELGMRKKPSTAELLAWVRVLATLNIDVDDLKPGEAEVVAMTYAILAKGKEDMALLRQQLG